MIELTHRVTSGLSALLVLAQLIFSRRVYPRGHSVRKSVGWAAFFMVVEVLIGAGIVLLEYVADDQSVGRAVWMAVHLVNTFLLVGAMTLAAHFASGAPRLSFRGEGWLLLLALGSVLGIMVAGVSGAVAALGDTLFPADSLGTALAADLSPAAHLLVRLRVIHPFAAVAVAFLLLATRFVFEARRPSGAVKRWGLLLRILVVAQVLAGFVNMLTLAPVGMQIVHLLLADALWIVLVLFLASGFALQPAVEPREEVSDLLESTAG